MKPSVGRIVHFVPQPGSPAAHNGASVVPAIIVRVWSDDMVNLKVFADGPEDVWAGSVTYNEENKEYSWHWPERV